MVRVLRSCIQSILKLVNSVIGMAGLAMILYSAWMIRVWRRQLGELPIGQDSDYPPPWFIYTFLGLGVTFCVITCSGHVAAETANGCCLYLYMVFVVLLIMLEAAISVDVFLNRDWEKDFPDDPSGNFDQFKNFIRSNFEMCKWIGLSLVSVQGLSLLLAMILKALGPHQYYDSDDEYAPDRVPLLKNAPPYVVDPGYGHGPKNETWIRINDKVIHCFKLNLDILSHGKRDETMLFLMSVGLVKDLSAGDGLAFEMMTLGEPSANRDSSI